MRFKRSITNEEVNKMPRKEFEGEIFLIDNFKKLDIALPMLHEHTILGFDTETKPAFKKGKVNQTALLQLASGKKAYLFRLNFIGLPDELTRILEDDSVLKIGVAIQDDLKSLKKLNPFNPGGFVELQSIAKDMDIKNTGLKKLAGIILNGRISKSQRLTNWENDTLTPAQVKYAATDAWVCYELYNEIINKVS